MTLYLLSRPRRRARTQNGFIESFNGRFRDECLNEYWFRDVSHARKAISGWRKDYNECRPHSTLNYQTPSEFAASWRKGHSESEGLTLTQNPAPFRNRIPA
ncbi:integrase core domain-containing protein [Yersinia intermedia]|uniref:integrase core domain-containing protein n=1 Tax=Yersinia intermedia TaxID=631 RepID=UPI0028BE12B3|nr:transposase [Yersinia intermedia]